MAEQKLNGPDIGARFKQMDGERVTQAMWRDRLGKAGKLMRSLACVFDGVSRDRLTRLAAREQPLLGPLGLIVVAQDHQQLRRQHHVAILSAFTLHHAEITIRLLSMQGACSRTDSEIRNPAA